MILAPLFSVLNSVSDMSGVQAREQDKEKEVRSSALLLNSTRTRVGVGRERRERGWVGAQRLMDSLRAAFVCSALTLSAVSPCWGQEGYSLQAGRVVVDSREHWERWHSAANTVQISDEGVKPAFIRKHTRLEIDGEEVVVPGINAVLNAADFGGGVLNAGSNRASAINLMDGRMDTFWEPDPSDLLQDWWVQIDLGRTVLKFVGEDLGDPFLQFKVTTSQGQKTLGQLLFRTRFTTDGPNKNERVFEIDLTGQLPTKWPDALGDFTGDVIQYVGVGITDSDFDRARQVSQPEYDSLPADQQGEIDYFRREASEEVRLLDGKEDWDALAGTERQGPIVYYRREIPRLAEIEVWTIGDNIGTGVLERGGRVTEGGGRGRWGPLRRDRVLVCQRELRPQQVADCGSAGCGALDVHRSRRLLLCGQYQNTPRPPQPTSVQSLPHSALGRLHQCRRRTGLEDGGVAQRHRAGAEFPRLQVPAHQGRSFCLYL
ncbi:MAG: hypothetical protein J4F35_17270 [Candidatus Latescibacteria bacterium]|nr:hypothetical protein [Candidatus Latescibacterota bacterium]